MQLTQILTNADLFPQFIISKIVKRADGRTDKIPCTPQGVVSSHKDSNNWLTLSRATMLSQKLGGDYRVGFSITRETKLFFFDVDKCLINGVETEIGKWSRQIFDGTGILFEISQSGTGYHFMGRYTGEVEHLNKNIPLGIELYTHDRFVMFGGIEPQGDWSNYATEQLKWLIENCFTKEAQERQSSQTVQTTQPQLTDEEIITRAYARHYPEAVFGKGASFKDLFEDNETVLSGKYPTENASDSYNRSSADMALANMIAVFTQDVEQIKRIMRMSKLARDKWDTHKTYLSTTVSNAVADKQSMQFSHQQSTKDGSGSQGTSEDDDDMCYYVKAEREIYSLKHGLLNQDGFNLCYGSAYQKELPYKLFRSVASESGLIVGRLGFRPDLPHGQITEREGITSINTYRKIPIKMREGDLTPFFKFLDAAWPDKRDQKIMLSYAAALAQKPGVKAQWCLIMQGVQGCGKSMFADFVAYACGETYTHRAKGDEFESRFNTQWFGKTLILVEDPRLQHAKLEEMLKPLITSTLLAFESKGKNVQMNDFCANYIITLNDFELLQKRKESRRLCILMSALQTYEDLINSGMTPAEFRKIVDWKNNGGNEFVAYYLHHYKVDPEFDFSGSCVTAPETSTTFKAIEMSRPEIEVLLLEEIELGRVGFRGGWLSSTVLTDFLVQRRISHLLPDRKRGQILHGMGYIYHPGLIDGRAVRNVMPDNKRPALFIKKGHPTINETDKELIIKAYEDAQK